MASVSSKIVNIAIGLLIAGIILPIGVSTLATQTDWTAENTTQVTDESLFTGDNTKLNYSGELANDYIVEGTVVVTYTLESDGSKDNLYDTIDNDMYVDYDTGEIEITCENYPEDASSITADYEYATSRSTWPSGVHTVLTLVLPILAAVGIALIFVKKTGLA